MVRSQQQHEKEKRKDPWRRRVRQRDVERRQHRELKDEDRGLHTFTVEQEKELERVLALDGWRR